MYFFISLFLAVVNFFVWRMITLLLLHVIFLFIQYSFSMFQSVAPSTMDFSYFVFNSVSINDYSYCDCISREANMPLFVVWVSCLFFNSVIMITFAHHCVSLYVTNIFAGQWIPMINEPFLHMAYNNNNHYHPPFMICRYLFSLINKYKTDDYCYYYSFLFPFLFVVVAAIVLSMRIYLEIFFFKKIEFK